jgi:hypothetical protein
MTVEAPGSNAKPKRRLREALKRRDKLVAKYIKDGMTKEEAEKRAQDEMRNVSGSRMDWRAK